MATTGNIPQELNWVERRVACTVSVVFNELRRGIENDIAIHADKTKPSDQEQVTAVSEDGASIVIGRPKKVPNRRVFVAMFENEIRVYDDAMQPKMSASVGLNNEGRCVLRLKDDTGTELEQWQFRKMVLEPVLFLGG